MTKIEVEPGVSLFTQVLGHGTPVVLVAGFGLDQRVWDREVQLLSAAHRVICVDQRGHGRSDAPDHGYDLARLAADLAIVLETLEVQAATLVGWSFGGQVAFQLAADRPDLVARLVLVGSNGVRASRSDEFPFGRLPELMEGPLIQAETGDRIASRRAGIVLGFAAPPEESLVEHLLEISLQMPTVAALACYHSMFTADLVDRIDDVAMPVLQIIGAVDPVHSARGAQWLSERLPDTELLAIDGCGHYPMFESPDVFDDALARFCGSGDRTHRARPA